MIANAITIFRTLLTAPLFACLAFGGEPWRWMALALFLGAGLLDMVDGRVARALRQTSAFGAMIDLVGDRLLTFAALMGLIAGGYLRGADVVAGLVLIARDLVVASLNEALPGKLEIKVSVLEKFKIAAAFAGIALTIAPPVIEEQSVVGAGVLWLAAALTCLTVADYWMRALTAFRRP